METNLSSVSFIDSSMAKRDALQLRDRWRSSTCFSLRSSKCSIEQNVHCLSLMLMPLRGINGKEAFVLNRTKIHLFPWTFSMVEQHHDFTSVLKSNRIISIEGIFSLLFYSRDPLTSKISEFISFDWINETSSDRFLKLTNGQPIAFVVRFSLSSSVDQLTTRSSFNLFRSTRKPLTLIRRIQMNPCVVLSICSFNYRSM